MKAIIPMIALMFAACASSPPSQDSALPSTPREICVLAGLPPSSVDFIFIRHVKLGKGTYGSVDELVPRIAEQARGLGAHAIVDFTGSQRFGFWPWRVVRPVVRGTAVKWSAPETVDCVGIGGTFY